MIFPTALVKLDNGTVLDLPPNQITNFSTEVAESRDFKTATFGIYSSTAKLSFINSSVIPELIKDGIKISGKVEFYINNGDIKYGERFASYLISDHKYNAQNNELTLKLSDHLIEWQNINVSMPLLSSSSGFYVYEYLKSVTPETFEFEELDTNTEQILRSANIPYPYINLASLWRQWNKLCELVGLHIYSNTKKKVVITSALSNVSAKDPIIIPPENIFGKITPQNTEIVSAVSSTLNIYSDTNFVYNLPYVELFDENKNFLIGVFEDQQIKYKNLSVPTSNGQNYFHIRKIEIELPYGSTYPNIGSYQMNIDAVMNYLRSGDDYASAVRPSNYKYIREFNIGVDGYPNNTSEMLANVDLSRAIVYLGESTRKTQTMFLVLYGGVSASGYNYLTLGTSGSIIVPHSLHFNSQEFVYPQNTSKSFTKLNANELFQNPSTVETLAKRTLSNNFIAKPYFDLKCSLGTFRRYSENTEKRIYISPEQIDNATRLSGTEFLLVLPEMAKVNTIVDFWYYLSSTPEFQGDKGTATVVGFNTVKITISDGDIGSAHIIVSGITNTYNSDNVGEIAISPKNQNLIYTDILPSVLPDYDTQLVSKHFIYLSKGVYTFRINILGNTDKIEHFAEILFYDNSGNVVLQTGTNGINVGDSSETDIVFNISEEMSRNIVSYSVWANCYSTGQSGKQFTMVLNSGAKSQPYVKYGAPMFFNVGDEVMPLIYKGGNVTEPITPSNAVYKVMGVKYDYKGAFYQTLSLVAL